MQGGPEKYYRATQRALFIHQAVLPEIPKEKISIIIGSMDSGINRLASFSLKSKRRSSFCPFHYPAWMG